MAETNSPLRSIFASRTIATQLNHTHGKPKDFTVDRSVIGVNWVPLFCIVLLGLVGEKRMTSAIVYFILVGGAIGAAFGLYTFFRSIKLI